MISNIMNLKDYRHLFSTGLEISNYYRAFVYYLNESGQRLTLETHLPLSVATGSRSKVDLMPGFPLVVYANNKILKAELGQDTTCVISGDVVPKGTPLLANTQLFPGVVLSTAHERGIYRSYIGQQMREIARPNTQLAMLSAKRNLMEVSEAYASLDSEQRMSMIDSLIVTVETQLESRQNFLRAGIDLTPLVEGGFLESYGLMESHGFIRSNDRTDYHLVPFNRIYIQATPSGGVEFRRRNSILSRELCTYGELRTADETQLTELIDDRLETMLGLPDIEEY